MKAQKKWIIITAIAAASCLALLIGLLLFDDYQLELNGQGQKITVSYGSEKRDNTCSIISFIRSLGYDLHNDAYSMPDEKEPDVSDLSSFPGKNCLKLVDNEYILMKLSD